MTIVELLNNRFSRWDSREAKEKRILRKQRKLLPWGQKKSKKEPLLWPYWKKRVDREGERRKLKEKKRNIRFTTKGLYFYSSFVTSRKWNFFFCPLSFLLSFLFFFSWRREGEERGEGIPTVGHYWNSRNITAIYQNNHTTFWNFIALCALLFATSF